MEWKPATIAEVKKVVQEDLARCSAEQMVAFEKYAVEPYDVPILRHGNTESVVVVARKEDAVNDCLGVDVEEGSSLSTRLRRYIMGDTSSFRATTTTLSVFPWRRIGTS